jgi:hypothetical protein
LKHRDYPFPDWNAKNEGTFHHLIALFCTVAGKAHRGKGLATNFCNEIKDLARVFIQEGENEKPFK